MTRRRFLLARLALSGLAFALTLGGIAAWFGAASPVPAWLAIYGAGQMAFVLRGLLTSVAG